MPITIWREFVEAPLVNYLITLVALTGSFGVAIVVLSVSTRALTLPLTIRSQRHAVRLRAIQPSLRKLSDRHPDREKRTAAQRDLMRDAGVNPLGALGPSLVQFPLFIAVNHAVRVATSNDGGAALSGTLYHVGLLRSVLPLDTHFLTLDLGQAGTLWMATLVLALMIAQQQFNGSQSSRSSKIVAVAMSGLFAAFVLRAPAGLGLYWLTSLLFGLAVQATILRRKRTSWEAELPQAELAGSTALGPSAVEPGTGGRRRNDASRRRRKQRRARRR